ncbi:MAG: MBL fold metallo-hydrolase [Candidatus Loosdrechtia sp.]|uniref:MBL fold metallo-hydrolase n=1 Tax=Candidatus Loosdrechtia sp. TaxID=3101272 RepID=UPI003A651451|nr:MAG: MBL fold metallo-hydrolase [Candidatus Jettenia sp. AMX2]
MFIQKLNVGYLNACCYVVAGKDSSDAMIIDPGADAEIIISFLRDKHLTPVMIVLTHGHGDHIGANADLKKAFPDIPICIHEKDLEMLPYPAKNLSILSAFYGSPTVRSPLADRVLKDKDTIGIGGYIFEVIHTPGHTPGGICLYTGSRGGGKFPVVFTGDSLFRGGVGRTDFPGCNQEELIRAIKERLFVLDDETVVYPGHGTPTTIGEEKKYNPFVSEVNLYD